MTTVLIIVICLLARKQNKTVFPKMSNYSLKRLNLQSCLWNVTFQKSGRRLILLQCDWDWLPHFIHNALVFRLEPSPLGILANQSHVFPQEQTGGCPVKLRLEWGMFIFSEWTHGGCLTSSLALAGAFQSLKKKRNYTDDVVVISSGTSQLGLRLNFFIESLHYKPEVWGLKEMEIWSQEGFN